MGGQAGFEGGCCGEHSEAWGRTLDVGRAGRKGKPEMGHAVAAVGARLQAPPKTARTLSPAPTPVKHLPPSSAIFLLALPQYLPGLVPGTQD